MPRKTFLIAVLITLSIIFGYCLVQFDKLGNTYALLCGLPVWFLAFVAIIGFFVGGMMWRPVREPGDWVETPNWLFWAFGGIFFLALGLGLFFTEPVVCTARDGDVCYESDTAWNVRNRDGSTYTGYYRNRWIWFVGDVIDAATSPHFNSGYSSSSGGSGIGDLFSGMELDDSEAAIIIILIILLVILAISSAFVPNLWVLVCGISLVCFFLTIVRVHKSESQEKPKNDALQDSLTETPLMP